MADIHPNSVDPGQRVASPGTEAIQNELARRLMIDREEFIERADASEMGSVLEGYMADRMAYHERELAGTNTVNNAEGGYIREVNFRGIYGPITQIEHIVTNSVALMHPTSVILGDCDPPAYSAPTSDITQLTSVRPIHRDSGSLPRRPVPRRSPGVQNLWNQASSSSTLRRRAAVEDLAQEVRYESNSSSGGPRDGANTYQPTVEVEEETVAQRPPQMLNGDGPHRDEYIAPPTYYNNNQEPPQYEHVRRNPRDHPLPPHLDVNDAIGVEFMAGIQLIRRSGELLQTFAAGFGVTTEDAGVQEILAVNERSITHLVTAYQQAAGAAANERRAHEMTNDLLNTQRLANRAVERNYMAQRRVAEAGYERQAVTMRLAADFMGTAVATIAELRQEHERLFGQVVAMEENFYG
jgi:hypothetical protein